MSGSSSTNSPNGSGAVITGTFSVVTYAENILSQYDKILMDILKSKATERQTEMRTNASASKTGWSEIANSIEVGYDHDSRSFTYTIAGDEATQRRAMDLEYGNGHLAPTPLLRTTILQQQDKDTDDINNALRGAFQRYL